MVSLAKPPDTTPLRREPLVPSRTVPINNMGRKETADEMAEKKIPFGKRAGLFLIGPRKPIGKRRQFSAQCDCGHMGHYSAQALLNLIDKKMGCGTDGCTAVGFKELVWGSPEESLRIQLHTLLLLCPEEVQSLWGGTLDDMWEVEFDQAFVNFDGYLQGQPHSIDAVWASRVDTSLPFVEGNVSLTTKADPLLRGMGSKMFDVGGQDMTMKELSQAVGLSMSGLLMRIYKIGSKEDLLLKLINWEGS